MEALYLPEWDAFLRYHDLPGREPARVYLHGLGLASSETFPRLVVEPAAAGQRSLLIDLLGFGYSDRPERFGYTLEGHARAVAALLDRLEIASCAAIGHSMGGAIAIVLAAMRPELVARLVLAETPLWPGAASTSRTIAAQSEEEFAGAGYGALLAGFRAEAVAGEPFAAALAGTWQVAAPHAIYRTARSLMQLLPPTLPERLARLPIPRAFVYGERTLRDPDSARDADWLRGRGIRVLVVPGAGHGMVRENPSGFAAALDRALSRA